MAELDRFLGITSPPSYFIWEIRSKIKPKDFPHGLLTSILALQVQSLYILTFSLHLLFNLFIQGSLGYTCVYLASDSVRGG